MGRNPTMHKALKFYRLKLALAMPLLMLVAVLPAVAQEREKSKEELPVLRTVAFAVIVSPISFPLPESRPTLFPETTSTTSRPPQGSSGQSDPWQFRLTPYVLFASLDGKLNVAGQGVPFN